MAADLKLIYSAATAGEAELRLAEFENKWDKQYKPISQSWHRNWARIIPFFDYPPEIRKVIYKCHRKTAYAPSQDREESGPLPQRRGGDQAIVSGLAQYRKDWKMPLRTWKLTANQFAIMFGERFTNVID